MLRVSVSQKNQEITWPDHLWPELCFRMSTAVQREEKHEWAIEKPKLHNARRLRGIYVVNPHDKVVKESHKTTQGTGWRFQWKLLYFVS